VALGATDRTVAAESRHGSTIMWKSFSLAAGIFACVVGVEMLLIDSAVILPLDGQGSPHTFTAPDWAPWTLLSVGAMTVLHFVSLPRSLSGGQ
jgi:hypothetical protein